MKTKQKYKLTILPEKDDTQKPKLAIDKTHLNFKDFGRVSSAKKSKKNIK